MPHRTSLFRHMLAPIACLSVACFEPTQVPSEGTDEEGESEDGESGETDSSSAEAEGDSEGDGDGDGDGDGGSLIIPPLLTGGDYTLRPSASQHEFLEGIMTDTYGYDASYLGPTLELRTGETVNVNVINELPAGVETTVHWHGMHIPSRWDGGPQTAFAPGENWNPSWEVRNVAATLWYHPHPMGQTQEQVARGLAGFLIIRDDTESALALPRTYGVDDLPLALQDKNLDPEGILDELGTLGNIMLVNGTKDATREVPAQLVRLRLLNGSIERGYMIGFDDERSFSVIATDDGLLPAPITVNRMSLTPGERVEIIVDLGDDEGDSVTLRSFGSELGPGVAGGPLGMGGMSPLDSADFDLVRFDVVAPTPDGITELPDTLVPTNVAPWAESDATVTRDMIFTQISTDPPRFAINGKTMDLSVIDETVTVNDVEIWQLVNQTGTAHPFHIHDVFFHVLDRNTNAPEDTEMGPKDTVLVGPGETVRVLTQFRDYVSDPGFPYMYHCHMLSHEDEGMMGQIETVP